jgi:lysophospholipase L1-like esterase
MFKFWQIPVILFSMATLSALGGEAPTILAIGDSITQGGKNFVCYRQVLIPELRKRNVAFEFIGPRKDSTSNHAGYGGRNTKYLLSISKQIYSQYPADIVMIHSGHNSFSKDKPVPGIVRDTEAIIKNIQEINPNVTILLAQAIPAGKLPKYSYIPKLNKELESLAARLNKRAYKIVLVNHADGFDWKTDTISDKVHPNAAGAKKMADKWMAALLPLLEKNDGNKAEENNGRNARASRKGR